MHAIFAVLCPTMYWDHHASQAVNTTAFLSIHSLCSIFKLNALGRLIEGKKVLNISHKLYRLI